MAATAPATKFVSRGPDPDLVTEAAEPVGLLELSPALAVAAVALPDPASVARPVVVAAPEEPLVAVEDAPFELSLPVQTGKSPA